MMSNAGCWKRQFATLTIATSLLNGCATVGSERSGFGTCALGVEYVREFQVQAAEDLALLPEGSALEKMLSDYAVLRDQVRVCLRRN